MKKTILIGRDGRANGTIVGFEGPHSASVLPNNILIECELLGSFVMFTLACVAGAPTKLPTFNRSEIKALLDDARAFGDNGLALSEW